MRAVRVPETRKPDKKKMTVAIGMYCMEGVIVCADTNVVSTDGVVTPGRKIAARRAVNGSSFVIANASNDGNAANMLGNEILDALANNPSDVEAVKTKMHEWHRGYSQGNAPQMSFVLASVISTNRRLYFCEAPNTVLLKRLGEPLAIGMGAQIIDPLFPYVVTGATGIETSLLLAAYLMYRAKHDLIFLKGSETNTLVILKDGMIVPIAEEEMAEAEKLGPEIDRMLQMCLVGLFRRKSTEDDRTFLKVFRKIFSESAKKRGRISFRSIEDLSQK